MKKNSKLKRTAITFLIGTVLWTGLPCWACAKEKGIYPARAGTILVTRRDRAEQEHSRGGDPAACRRL